MNKEEIEKEIKFTASIPILTQEEINGIDMNMNEFINQFTKMIVKEKDLVIAQYIIKKQEDKIKELEQKSETLDKVTDRLKEDKNKKIPLAEDMDWVICRKQYAREILNIIEGEK